MSFSAAAHAVEGLFCFLPYQTGGTPAGNKKEDSNMAFGVSAITVLQTLVIALGAGLGIWGAINFGLLMRS